MANLLGENLVLICISYMNITEDLFNSMNMYTELNASVTKMVKV